MTTARQSTAGNVCVMVCAPAVPLPNGMNRTIRTAVVANSPMARRRLEPVGRINVPPVVSGPYTPATRAT